MKYDFSKGTYPQQKAQEYLSKLIKDGSKASLTKIHPKRSVSQNSYLHVLFSLWGKENGWYLEEAKLVVKRELGYTYTKRNQEFADKTSKMDTAELTKFIDKFRIWSFADGCYLPTADEYKEEQIYFDNQINQ
ncbi:hypothetical protein LCGC14_0388170 [marine sediment metagenome]|uniref:Uncharacterized protein n=1 Tax=marine sediment metagenome TaxID=412755 RepID=A0A0F9T079_9ZZZZ